MKKTLLFTAITFIIALYSCGKKESALSGAGATFPAPYYNIVFKEYAKIGSNVTYGAIGSGGGIRSLKDQTVDFGATDVFLSDAELKDMGTEIVHIPTSLGAVVLSYNLKGVKELKLTADIISDIYRGKITKWNDTKIKDLNPRLDLPNKGITAVYRSDGSGTTSVFSEYMSKVNEAWKIEIGEGKSLKFPVGIAAKGNPGVAGIVAETEGAIGYIGSEYALALNMPSALLQNSAGNFIAADTKSISASANVDIPNDTRVVITNSPNPEAYPISTFTWIIAYKEQNYNARSEVQAKSLVGLLNYIISEEGQAIANKTHYAPLPPVALEKTKAIIESMTFEGKRIETYQLSVAKGTRH
ncbi:phosphate ABC transporter substrate-binding protein PstS [Dysgonomonas sp. Marseille-P4677]|uniref:phosphate ABC transporter substrate-binding protein PstS n=1 Tax=Dysgonomonas sp. Marseille-P4677 TaxID=2364790 RepID=UPI0019144903|nr:phosphate ABC transporter substrate-binding protein PstS [Dysgonomonas sp. Marseille-P4677]MBK5720534.1 phosphate ABC transporter substrate-binding protein PstS [Dysgonomonas sp. Marseille-P4677]